MAGESRRNPLIAAQVTQITIPLEKKKRKEEVVSWSQKRGHTRCFLHFSAFVTLEVKQTRVGGERFSTREVYLGGPIWSGANYVRMHGKKAAPPPSNACLGHKTIKNEGKPSPCWLHTCKLQLHPVCNFIKITQDKILQDCLHKQMPSSLPYSNTLKSNNPQGPAFLLSFTKQNRVNPSSYQCLNCSRQ